MAYKDPEKEKEYQKKYKQENKDKVKEYLKKYYEENKEYLCALKPHCTLYSIG